MKKLSYILLVLMFCLVTVILTGCCDKCDKPQNNDVSKDSTWQVRAEGIITDFKLIKGTNCYCTVHDPNSCSNNDYYFLIDETKQIVAGKIEYPTFIKIGSTGKLYKYDTGLPDNKSWFQWIMSEKKEISIEKKEIIFKEKPIIIFEEIVNTEWKKHTDLKELKTNELVLIKLTDGIITTGFITYNKKWKLGSNVNQYGHGRTLINVYRWKKINTE